MKKSGSVGFLFIILTGILWGTIGIFVKELSARGVPALTIAFLRVAFACLLLAAFTVMRGGVKALAITKKQLLYCAMPGIVCQGIYNIFYSYAVPLAGVAVSAVLLNIAPVITLLVSAVVFHEQVNGSKILAIILNVVGCVLTATGGIFSLQAFSLLGIACGLGAGVSYALCAILGKFAVDKTDPFLSSTYSYLFAALLLVIPGKPWALAGNPHLLEILLLGLGFGLIPSALAYVLYYKGLSMIHEPGKVPVAASGETVVATLLGVMIYHEAVGAVRLIGVALVLLSIVFMCRKTAKAK